MTDGRRPAADRFRQWIAVRSRWTVVVSFVAALVAHGVVAAAGSAPGFTQSLASHGAAGGKNGRAMDGTAVNQGDCRRYETKDPTIYVTDFQWGLATEQFKKNRT